MRSGLPGIVALHQYRADLIAAAGAGLRGQPQAAHCRGGARDGDAAERVGQQPGHRLDVVDRSDLNAEQLLELGYREPGGDPGRVGGQPLDRRLLVVVLIGDLADEYDTEQPPVEWLSADSARVTARLPVAELEEEFGVRIDAEDVETVAGLLAHALGRVPIAGSTASVSGLRLTAENLEGRRNKIGTVLVEREAGEQN